MRKHRFWQIVQDGDFSVAITFVENWCDGYFCVSLMMEITTAINVSMKIPKLSINCSDSTIPIT